MEALSRRGALTLFAAAALLAGLAPLLPRGGMHMSGTAPDFPGWPQAYEGRPLTPLPLTANERFFAQDFPGQIGRFSSGTREIVIRWVNTPTRQLHPAADCLRGVGFAVTPQSVQRNGAGQPMGCLLAVRQSLRLRVCEYVSDGRQQSWPDVSSWFWHALLWPDSRAWWSYVIAERVP
jgi:hypothetical protein